MWNVTNWLFCGTNWLFCGTIWLLIGTIWLGTIWLWNEMTVNRWKIATWKITTLVRLKLLTLGVGNSLLLSLTSIPLRRTTTGARDYLLPQVWVTGNICCGFSLSTEPPSVKRNFTSDQGLVHSKNHSVRRKNVFWTWCQKMLITSDMGAAISLLKVYCGVVMIAVCL